eukprot:XP_001689520.1 guanylate cyclase [Chlamydomonas reinhardtii]
MVHVPFFGIDLPEPRLAAVMPDAVYALVQGTHKLGEYAHDLVFPPTPEDLRKLEQQVNATIPREFDRVRQRYAEGKIANDEQLSSELEDASFNWYRRQLRTSVVGATDEELEDVAARLADLRKQLRPAHRQAIGTITNASAGMLVGVLVVKSVLTLQATEVPVFTSKSLYEHQALAAYVESDARRRGALARVFAGCFASASANQPNVAWRSAYRSPDAKALEDAVLRGQGSQHELLSTMELALSLPWLGFGAPVEDISCRAPKQLLDKVLPLSFFRATVAGGLTPTVTPELAFDGAAVGEGEDMLEQLLDTVVAGQLRGTPSSKQTTLGRSVAAAAAAAAAFTATSSGGTRASNSGAEETDGVGAADLLIGETGEDLDDTDRALLQALAFSPSPAPSAGAAVGGGACGGGMGGCSVHHRTAACNIVSFTPATAGTASITRQATARMGSFLLPRAAGSAVYPAAAAGGGGGGGTSYLSSALSQQLPALGAAAALADAPPGSRGRAAGSGVVTSRALQKMMMGVNASMTAACESGAALPLQQPPATIHISMLEQTHQPQPHYYACLPDTGGADGYPAAPSTACSDSLPVPMPRSVLAVGRGAVVPVAADATASACGPAAGGLLLRATTTSAAAAAVAVLSPRTAASPVPASPFVSTSAFRASSACISPALPSGAMAAGPVPADGLHSSMPLQLSSLRAHSSMGPAPGVQRRRCERCRLVWSVRAVGHAYLYVSQPGKGLSLRGRADERGYERTSTGGARGFGSRAGVHYSSRGASCNGYVYGCAGGSSNGGGGPLGSVDGLRRSTDSAGGRAAGAGGLTRSNSAAPGYGGAGPGSLVLMEELIRLDECSEHGEAEDAPSGRSGGGGGGGRAPAVDDTAAAGFTAVDPVDPEDPGLLAIAADDEVACMDFLAATVRDLGEVTATAHHQQQVPTSAAATTESMELPEAISNGGGGAVDALPASMRGRSIASPYHCSVQGSLHSSPAHKAGGGLSGGGAFASNGGDRPSNSGRLRPSDTGIRRGGSRSGLGTTTSGVFYGIALGAGSTHATTPPPPTPHRRLTTRDRLQLLFGGSMRQRAATTSDSLELAPAPVSMGPARRSVDVVAAGAPVIVPQSPRTRMSPRDAIGATAAVAAGGGLKANALSEDCPAVAGAARPHPASADAAAGTITNTANGSGALPSSVLLRAAAALAATEGRSGGVSALTATTAFSRVSLVAPAESSVGGGGAVATMMTTTMTQPRTMDGLLPAAAPLGATDESMVFGPRHTQKAQAHRQGGDGGDAPRERLMITLTQIDVTEQVEAQARLAKMLEQEHKVLEGIYPRHVIEYLTLEGRESVGDGGAGTGAGGRSGNGGDQCLLSLLPGNVARMASLATWHSGVTVLFADIVGFTTMCTACTPLAVMAFLNQLYSRLDAMIDIYKVYKVETIGDCYMVAGGLVAHDDDGYKSVISGGEDPLHAVRVMEFAKAMLRVSRELRMPHTNEPVQMRIGMHSGPVTSGVVGERMPRFCLFGDTVNTASRMESTCRPGSIHVSAETRARLPSEPWHDRGMKEVKGKGAMQTYEWAGDADEVDGDQLQRVMGVYL